MHGDFSLNPLAYRERVSRVLQQMGRVQLAVAAKMLQMNANMDSSVVKLLDAAGQNMDRLANVSAGIGTNLDVSV